MSKKYKIPASYIVGYLRGGDIILSVNDNEQWEFDKAIKEGDDRTLRGFVEGFTNMNYRIEDWDFGSLTNLEEIQ